MSTTEKASILVSLDALFDTRLATLYKLDPQAAEKILTEGNYYRRLHDVFPGVSKPEYEAAYLSRDVKTLRRTVITRTIEHINFFIARTIAAAAGTPFIRKPSVVINTYPYQLTETEVDMIILGVVAATRKEADVSVVRLSHEELTPRFIKANYVTVILYDYWNWSERQAELGGFEDTQCPQVTMIAPMLVSSPEAWEEIKRDPLIFDKIESFYEPCIGLKLYPIEFFSANWRKFIEINQPEPEESKKEESA